MMEQDMRRRQRPVAMAIVAVSVVLAGFLTLMGKVMRRPR